MDPAQRAFEEDVAGAVFQRGLARGKWRIVKDTWPNPLIAISASEREASPAEYFFRFDLNGYPASAPSSQIWDEEENALLAEGFRPGGSWNVQKAFRSDWSPNALYIPCDRLALNTHPNWSSMPGAWKPGHDITHYLTYVHALLNSPGYTGARRTRAPA